MAIEKRWHTRGYLPHLELPGATQFITWRLADSLPASVLAKIRAEADLLEERSRNLYLAERIDAFCDTGHGECVLADFRAAKIIEDALFVQNGRAYDLRAWAVMPNHVHVLLQIGTSESLSQIMHQIKGSSAREINRVLGRRGRLWQPEYFDRVIHGNAKIQEKSNYIEANPVQAGLCKLPNEWSWSSANLEAVERLRLAGGS